MFIARRAVAAITALSLACTLAFVVITQQTASADSCAAVMFVGVRGSGEPQGMGTTVQDALKAFTATATKSVSSYALVYPAASIPIISGNISIPAYFDSVAKGKAAFANYLNSQHAKCPSQHFVIAGYSQGALVTGEGMKMVPASLHSYIDGIVLFGDPRFDPKFSGDVGNFSRDEDGVWYYISTNAGNAPYYPADLAPKVKSYCIGWDPVCNFTTGSLINCFWASVCAHDRYISVGYTRQGGQFLASRT